MSVSRRAGAAADGTGHVDKFGDFFERGAALAGDLDAVGEEHGELVFGHGDDAAGGAVNDGDRRAPVALAGDAPVLDAVGDGGFAEALGFGVSAHFAARFVAGEAALLAAIFDDAVVAEGFGHAGSTARGPRRGG